MKIAYIASPYSRIENKELLMRHVAKFSGEYMLTNPGWYAVTGLIHHYASLEVGELGTDYSFWEGWCQTFLKRCDKLIVLMINGWDNSTGVKAEIEFAILHGIPVEYVMCEGQNDIS